MNQKYAMDGYVFQNAADYERARKEKETIAYLSANTNMTDMKAVYKIYRLSVEKKSFQTIFGLQYMEDLRSRLVGSGIVGEEMLEPIPVARIVVAAREKKPQPDSAVEKYKEEAQKRKAGGMIKNFLIVVLVLIIAGMLFITSKNQYSILTYFTNYKEKMRDEIVNEMEEWETRLNEKEEELNQRESLLQEREETAE